MFHEFGCFFIILFFKCTKGTELSVKTSRTTPNCTRTAKPISTNFQSSLQWFHQKCTECTKCTRKNLSNCTKLNEKYTIDIYYFSINIVVISPKMHEMHKVNEGRGLSVKTCRRNYSKCTSCTTTARANLDSYSQTYSVFMINARNAPNARDKSMLRANTTNALGAQQLHELIWAVTVNLAVISL